jgi:uncharacterized protein YndB with AHSA1/START domain
VAEAMNYASSDLMSADDADAITLEVTLDAPVERVWDAIASEPERRHWWSYLALEAIPGGRLLERWQDAEGRERTTSGEVLDARAPHLLRCSWRDDDWAAATEVEFTLRPEGGASRLRLRHSGWARLGPVGEDLRPAHRDGWRRHLANLKRYVESNRT